MALYSEGLVLSVLTEVGHKGHTADISPVKTSDRATSLCIIWSLVSSKFYSDFRLY